MSYRKQKRWWNAYILLYERMDADDEHRIKEFTKSMQDLTIGTSCCVARCAERELGADVGGARAGVRVLYVLHVVT